MNGNSAVEMNMMSYENDILSSWSWSVSNIWERSVYN